MLRLLIQILTLIHALLAVANPADNATDDEQTASAPVEQPQSQPEPAPKRHMTFTPYFQYDTRGFDTGNVNLALWQNQLPILPEKRNGGGGGMVVTRGRWVFGGNGGGAGGLNRDGTAVTSFGFGYGSSDIGFIMARTGWFRAFPFVGVGGGGIGARANPDEEADSSSNTDAADFSVSSWGGLFNVGIGLDFTPSIGIRGLRLVFGLRIGYSYAPLQNVPDDTTPTFLMSGPFVRGVVGFMVGG